MASINGIEGKISVQGLPFEQRCKLAEDTLRYFKTQMASMADEDLVYQQQRWERRNAVLKKVSETARKSVKLHFDKMDEDGNKEIGVLYQNCWNVGLNFVRTIFGVEETEVAMRTLKQENSKQSERGGSNGNKETHVSEGCD